MTHFGVITPPVPGHLHPFGALARELSSRGHRVTFFHAAELESKVRAEGADFRPLGTSWFPEDEFRATIAKLGTLKGAGALRFTIQAIARTTELICRDGPAAIEDAGVEALLVDQTEPAGGSIAEVLRLPFVTVCNALVLNGEPSVPPPFTAWSYRDGAFAELRNRVGYWASRVVTRPLTGLLAKYRRAWGLPRRFRPDDHWSQLLQLSQQPARFDYPRRALPSFFHYTGPLRRTGTTVPFPWEKLDGRPLIYASLGTLQNTKEALFRKFVEACKGLDAQLVLSHGGGLGAAAVAEFSETALVVSYAPQVELLEHASLVLTHAGLNTVLDALSQGVPLVAVPITYEQPAIAERIAWSGAGKIVGLQEASTSRLRAMIQEVLTTPRYAAAARLVQESIRDAGGVARACDLIERAVLERRPVARDAAREAA